MFSPVGVDRARVTRQREPSRLPAAMDDDAAVGRLLRDLALQAIAVGIGRGIDGDPVAFRARVRRGERQALVDHRLAALVHDARRRGDLRVAVRRDVLGHEVEEAAALLQQREQDQRVAAGSGDRPWGRGRRRGCRRYRRGGLRRGLLGRSGRGCRAGQRGRPLAQQRVGLPGEKDRHDGERGSTGSVETGGPEAARKKAQQAQDHGAQRGDEVRHRKFNLGRWRGSRAAGAARPAGRATRGGTACEAPARKRADAHRSRKSRGSYHFGGSHCRETRLHQSMLRLQTGSRVVEWGWQPIEIAAILDRPVIRRILTQVATSAALPMDRLRRVFDCGSTSPPRSPAG